MGGKFNSFRPNFALCVGKLAITWTNAGLLLVRPFGTNFSKFWSNFYWRKCIWKCRLQCRRPFCLGFKVLTSNHYRKLEYGCAISLIQKSHNVPISYATMHHSEQKCVHFCSEWCTVGYGTGAVWDYLDLFIMLLVVISFEEPHLSHQSQFHAWSHLCIFNDVQCPCDNSPEQFTEQTVGLQVVRDTSRSCYVTVVT